MRHRHSWKGPAVDSDRKAQVLQFLLAAAGTALLLWSEAPEWQRKQTMMLAARMVARAAGRPHRGAGRAGIAAEARGGCEEAGTVPYSLARFLGQVRECATRAYEQMGA